ncbi:MAG: hypothetical protein AzoDbin1_04574 [Azoarcus sp.]|nr:hypothetical protein [Azoarcus sp.]
MWHALLLVLVTLSSAAFAATNDVTRETEGYGATQQEAVANALVEAVRQVRGSAAGVDRSVEETMAVVAGAGGMVIEKTTKPVQDVYTESRGFVRSYQVLEQRATDKSVYVRIRALVPSFESAISDAGKKRIAVLPFRVTPDGYRLADHGDAMAFSQRLADHLVTQMSTQQDVVVVNRDFFAELGLEKAVLGADAAPEELTKLGASVGADFLLVGRVQEARTETEPGAYGSKPKKTDEIRLTWRMVEAATGKLLGAGDVAFDNLRKEKNRYSWTKRNDFEAGELFTALAQQVTGAALAQEAEPADAMPAAPTAAPAIELTPGSSDKPLTW